MGGNIEESLKANVALVKVFPLMIAAMLIVINTKVRSLSTMTMAMLSAPLGLSGVGPTLFLFNQPFGLNAIRVDRTGRYFDAQHPDPNRADKGEPGGRPC